jgi:3-deoxy-7-phosphoheptulonate synthase
MSPETTKLNTETIMGDAMLLKPVLLRIQEKINEQAQKTIEEELEKEGFDQTEELDDDYIKDIINTRIEGVKVRISPKVVKRGVVLTKESAETTRRGRINVEKILIGKNGRVIVIVGPCSIHDPEAALEYAQKVKEWRALYGDDLEIVMRVYTEKPRTELKEDPVESWKGLAYDPHLDGSNDINLGIIASRLLAREITAMGVPVAAERLDPVTPQYLDGLVVYDAIGARDTTSQNARHYGSGTSSVLGFKNTAEGSIVAAIEAAASANVKSTFSGSSDLGLPGEFWTKGNPTAHIILRGYQRDDIYYPNYSEEIIKDTAQKLKEKGTLEAILVDASHANSSKKASRQIEVVKEVCRQMMLGEFAIKGVMIESNLVAGKQNLKKARDIGGDLVYGQSITDECVGLRETENMLALLAGAIKMRRTILKANGINV